MSVCLLEAPQPESDRRRHVARSGLTLRPSQALDGRTLAGLTKTDPDSLGAFLDALMSLEALTRYEQGRDGLTAFSRRMVAGAEGAASIPVLLGWIGSAAPAESRCDRWGFGWTRCDVSIGCSPGRVWETGVTTLQNSQKGRPGEQSQECQIDH